MRCAAARALLAAALLAAVSTPAVGQSPTPTNTPTVTPTNTPTRTPTAGAGVVCQVPVDLSARADVARGRIAHVAQAVANTTPVPLVNAPATPGQQTLLTHFGCAADGAAVVSVTGGGHNLVPPLRFTGAGTQTATIDPGYPMCAPPDTAVMLTSSTTANVACTAGFVQTAP